MRFLILSFLLALAGVAFGQAFDGTVRDASDQEPIVGASVVVKDQNGKINNFTTTNINGCFMFKAIPAPGSVLEVSFLGYQKLTLPTDSLSPPLVINLEPGSIELREVTVKAEAIREQGDTLTYSVASFAQAQDRSIGDVLKRMPGIDVEKSGRIKYQGEDINKFYVEGSDLLGGRYGLATNGISQDDVGAVEVMENHQPLQVLSGLSFSDRAAINLKLKEKAKMTLSAHGSASGGLMWPQTDGDNPSGLWQGELFGMGVMADTQTLFTARGNNIGDDLTGIAFDFLEGSSTILSPYIDVLLPMAPDLREKRTMFNTTVLASFNHLMKLKSGELKAKIDYRFNRATSWAAETTTYFLDGDNSVAVSQDSRGRQRTHSLDVNAEYELNAKKTYLDDVLKASFYWDDVRLVTSSSAPNTQLAHQPQFSVSNEFKTIKRVGDKHLITLQSHNQWQSMPQNLQVGYAGIPYGTHEETHDHALCTDESAAYTFVIHNVTLSLTGGLKGYLRKMSSTLAEDWLDPSLPYGTVNCVHTNYVGLSASAKMEYRLRRVRFIFTLPVSTAYYGFDKVIANRWESYLSPSLKVHWKPTQRFEASTTLGVGRSPMGLHQIHPGLILTDYRTLQGGTDDFYSSTSQSVSGRVAYKHPHSGLFGNAMVSHFWNNLPYTQIQQVVGDNVIYAYSGASTNRSRSLSADVTLGKTLEWIRGSMSLLGSYYRSSQRMISQQSLVASVTTSRSLSLKISGHPISWLGFDATVDYGDNALDVAGQLASPRLSSLVGWLKLVFTPHPRWQWHLAGDLYHTEQSEGNFQDLALVDTRLSFKPSKRIELSAELSNIFNKRTYSFVNFSELSSYQSQRQLRPRQLLLTITLQK